MKNSLLLIMTPNMSLAAWNEAGLLSREMDIYNKICVKAGLRLTIFSYGRNEKSYLPVGQAVTVLEMPNWIPLKLPYTLQNLIYQFVSLFIYAQKFRMIRLSKTNQYAASHFGLVLKLLYGIPLVIRMGYYHTHLKKSSWFSRLVERINFNLCDKILVTSIDASNFIKKRYRIPNDKIKSICNSIDMNRFKPSENLKEYDVLFVGRLAEVKNISLLTEFLEKTELNVHIIGDGEHQARIKRITADKKNVTWCKRVENSQLPFYYNRARVYILISKYEGNPKSLLEAMACGLPCIGTDVNGIRECIQNGWNGLLINSDVKSLESAINLLLLDTDLAAKLGNNAFGWISQQCDMNNNIISEVEFYKSLSATSPLPIINTSQN